MITIKNIKTILTAPQGVNLIVVKVETSEAGLYGLGCATFTYREKAVQSVVEDYLKPLLLGRDAANIEDIWHLMNNNSYWRNGGIANNAISGVDMALWDIKGKIANMPVYDLLGGKSREAAKVYMHANGETLGEIENKIKNYLKDGINHVRIQWGLYGGKAETMNTPPYSQQGAYFNPGQYMKDTVKMFEYIRDKFGDDVELLHDCHERLTPSDAVYLAKKLEQYRLFFLEDVLPPEQGEWIKHIKSQTTTPIAIGELFNNPKEWEYLISNRLIDYVRVHISQIGGITPARKLATLCEQFGIRTAWHGPGDVSPIGHAANIHLDLAVHNFGIQEWCGFDDVMYEVFPGTPQLKNGYLHVSAAPGLGIKINEKLAEKYPAETKVTTWTQTRLPDGTLVNP